MEEAVLLTPFHPLLTALAPNLDAYLVGLYYEERCAAVDMAWAKVVVSAGTTGKAVAAAACTLDVPARLGDARHLDAACRLLELGLSALFGRFGGARAAPHRAPPLRSPHANLYMPPRSSRALRARAHTRRGRSRATGHGGRRRARPPACAHPQPRGWRCTARPRARPPFASARVPARTPHARTTRDSHAHAHAARPEPHHRPRRPPERAPSAV